MPLQYPPMVYLALRLTWIAVSRTRSARPMAAGDAAPPPRRRAPTTWRATATHVRRLGAHLGAGDAAGRHAGPALRAQRLRLQRDRRRLCRRDRRRPHRPRHHALRHDAHRLRHLRHLRPAELHRLRPVRAGGALARHLGLAAGGPRRRDALRHPLPGGDVRARVADVRPAAGHGFGPRLGRLPVHGLRPRDQRQRLAGRGHAHLGPGRGATSHRTRRDARARAGHQVRPGRPAAALEPASLPAPRAGPQPASLHRGPGHRRGADRVGAPARRLQRAPRLLVADHRLPARTRLPVLDLGPVPRPAAGADRPDGGGRHRGPGRAALAAPAGHADHDGPLRGAPHRDRAHRDALVLPLHPVVPALRPGGDGPRLAAAARRPREVAELERAAAPAPMPVPT